MTIVVAPAWKAAVATPAPTPTTATVRDTLMKCAAAVVVIIKRSLEVGQVSIHVRHAGIHGRHLGHKPIDLLGVRQVHRMFVVAGHGWRCDG